MTDKQRRSKLSKIGGAELRLDYYYSNIEDEEKGLYHYNPQIWGMKPCPLSSYASYKQTNSQTKVQTDVIA